MLFSSAPKFLVQLEMKGSRNGKAVAVLGLVMYSSRHTLPDPDE